MARYYPSKVDNALLVFADVVDSSILSAYHGPLKYANLLLNFQSLFEKVGRKYFLEEEDNLTEYSSISARGDEGVLFYVTDKMSKNELVYKAIEFIFELKGRLRMIKALDENPDRPVKSIELGAGIHFGPIALLTAIEKDANGKNRSLIKRIEGYSINYAKRVESCSRRGSFSRVFLSKEASDIIYGEPVILSKTLAPLKGIGENVEVFEVRSGYFHDIPIRTGLPDDEKFINFIDQLSEYPEKIDESWIKPLIVSVIDSRMKNNRDKVQQKIYQSRLDNLVWYRPDEDDPILLFLRAREYECKNEQTARIRYLKKIIDDFPYFIRARIKLIDACWKIIKQKEERSEKIFARDTAREFITRFSDYLTNNEKEECIKIINEVQKGD